MGHTFDMYVYVRVQFVSVCLALLNQYGYVVRTHVSMTCNVDIQILIILKKEGKKNPQFFIKRKEGFNYTSLGDCLEELKWSCHLFEE